MQVLDTDSPPGVAGIGNLAAPHHQSEGDRSTSNADGVRSADKMDSPATFENQHTISTINTEGQQFPGPSSALLSSGDVVINDTINIPHTNRFAVLSDGEDDPLRLHMSILQQLLNTGKTGDGNASNNNDVYSVRAMMTDNNLTFTLPETPDESALVHPSRHRERVRHNSKRNDDHGHSSNGDSTYLAPTASSQFLRVLQGVLQTVLNISVAPLDSYVAAMDRSSSAFTTMGESSVSALGTPRVEEVGDLLQNGFEQVQARGRQIDPYDLFWSGVTAPAAGFMWLVTMVDRLVVNAMVVLYDV
eukprot:7130287-Pyramimonas_sp.AAC.2